MGKGKERSTSTDAPAAARSPGDVNDHMDQQSKTYADAARLMTQPLAGAAVLSAMGIGMATQAFGMWLTAVSSAMQGAQRSADAPSIHPEPKPETSRAAPAARPKPAADEKVVKFVSKAERAAKTPKRKPATAAKPMAKAAHAADDLKAISGVGPKLESVLNQLGIRTYAQVASLSGEDIASLEEQLGFKGRIGRDDWIGQARTLMAGGKA